MSICVSVCLFVCSLFDVPFNGLFAPTSRSQMSNIFRDSESLGKSNGKKWSHIWTFLFGSGLKSPRKKKFFLCADFALQNMLETTLPSGLETSGRRVYRLFWHISWSFGFFAFLVIFSVFQKNWVLRYSWSTLLWYRCYYPHRSRDALSPVCGIFFQTISHVWDSVFYQSSKTVSALDTPSCNFSEPGFWILTRGA